MKHPIQFVSLGPGEAELITVKGLKTLQQATVIYCPATVTVTGKLLSRAARILEELEINPARIRLFGLPMHKNRKEAYAAYDGVYREVCSLYEQEEQIAIVAEGDAGFYSSVQYICDQFKASGIPVTRIAGIPAFIAAGALSGLHIVKQEENLKVYPGTITTEELAEDLEKQNKIVIMKLSQCEANIKQCMENFTGHEWHYFENVGTEKELYLSDPQEIKKRSFPYFSLMIIQ